MTDFSARTGPTFLDGALLVAAAIPDAGLVYRGSTCVDERVRQTLRPHTRAGTLETTSHGGRMVLTMDPYSVAVLGTEDRVDEAVEHLAAQPGIRLILIASLSRYTLTGEKLEPVARRLDALLPEVAVQALSTRSLTRDHSDAFRVFYDGLAGRLIAQGLEAGAPETVGVLGYPWTRDSGDSRGDLAEIARLVGALGLTWNGALLDGRPSTDFPAVAGSGTLLAFPDAADAADALAEATGAALVCGAIPVSLEDTGTWLRALAAGTGRGARCQELIDAELDHVVPLLDRAVHRGLLGRRAVVAAPGEWLPSLVRCLQEDLGIIVTAALARTRHDVLRETWDQDAPLHTDPSIEGLNRAVGDARARGGLDLIIGSNWERNALEAGHRTVPFVEFGYPQRQAWFLRPTPHLGYTGVLTWAERLLAAVRATH
jgi:nitrogenase molybdenum-iron protein alpha/beta subunit